MLMRCFERCGSLRRLRYRRADNAHDKLLTAFRPIAVFEFDAIAPAPVCRRALRWVSAYRPGSRRPVGPRSPELPASTTHVNR